MAMRALKLKVYREKKTGDWRWRISARNGKIVGASTEGYKTRRRAVSNCILITNTYVRCFMPKDQKLEFGGTFFRD